MELEQSPAPSEPEEERPLVDGPAISTSFWLLEQLLLSEKIPRTKMETLKNKISVLAGSLKRSQESEVGLLQEAQRLHSELKSIQEELDFQENLEEPSDTEADQLRHHLLDAHNQVTAAEELHQQSQTQILCLLEERRWLLEERTRESDHELQSRTSNLQEQNHLLRDEVAQSRAELSRLTEDLQQCETETLNEEKLLQEVKQENFHLLNVPEQVVQTACVADRREDAMKQKEILVQRASDQEQQLQQLQEVGESLRSRMKEAQEQLEELVAELEAGEQRCRNLEIKKHLQQEDEAELTGHRGILEMKLRGLTADRHLLQEHLRLLLKERSRLSEVLTTTQRSVSSASEQLQQMVAHARKLQEQYDALSKSQSCIQQRELLRRNMDALMVRLDQQLQRCGSDSQESRERLEVLGLQEESDRLCEEIRHLTSLRQLRAEEKNLKHRELVMVQGTLRNLDLDLAGKNLMILDQKKLDSCLRRRTCEYMKLCELVTAERNKLVDLKRIAAHRTTELTQQLLLLENQVEIQRCLLEDRESLHCKAQMKISNHSKSREHVQNLHSQEVLKLRRLAQVFEDDRAELQAVKRSTELQETVLLLLSNSHQVAVQRRNTLGVQLLQEEQEVVGCYERLQLQEKVLMKGSLSLELLEKKSRELQIHLDDQRRQVELKEKEVLLCRKLEEELVLLMIQLLEARAETLQAVNHKSEHKEVKGSDLSPLELVKKEEQLELSLARKERHLLEKRLLVEQATRLTTPLAGQVEECRLERLSLAQKLNQLRGSLITSSDRLMSVSAQLSMKQAAVFSRQQELREKEMQLDSCRCRVALGLPPCPEMEEKWRKMLQDRRRREKDRAEQEERAQQKPWYQLPSGEWTTAEPRPSAYVPQTDGLPLPRPYGALAPVKPWQPAAASRHFLPHDA